MKKEKVLLAPTKLRKPGSFSRLIKSSSSLEGEMKVTAFQILHHTVDTNTSTYNINKAAKLRVRNVVEEKKSESSPQNLKILSTRPTSNVVPARQELEDELVERSKYLRKLQQDVELVSGHHFKKRVSI
jgi:hypothetical protein